MKKKKTIRWTEVLLPVVSALYLIGTRTFLSPCGPKEDGSYMTCHWAGEALFGLACALTVICVLHLLVKESAAKRALDLALLPAAALLCVLPQGLISLCMMHSMRCHSVMRPGAIVAAVLLAGIALADYALQKPSKKEV